MRIFISYRRGASSDIVGRIDDHLRKHFGPDSVFRDVDNIPIGVDFHRVLIDAISNADVLLVVIGPDWLSRGDLADPNDFVRIEVAAALERGVKVIPVLVKEAPMPTQQELPEVLWPMLRQNALEVESGADFKHHVGRLVDGIIELVPALAESVPARDAASSSSGSTGIIIAAMVVLALAGFGAVFALGGSKTDDSTPTTIERAAAPGRDALNAAYRQADEVPPPDGCATTDAQAIKLFTGITGRLSGGKPKGRRPEDLRALQLLDAQAYEASAEYWYLLARARLFAGQPEAEVLAAVKRSTSLCEGFAPPLNIEGTVHLLAARFDAAQASYAAAVRAAQGYLAPRFNLGLVALRTGAVADATRSFDEVLLRDPEYASAYRMRAAARMADDNAAGAVDDLNNAIQRRPKDAMAYFLLGQAHAKLSQSADAVRAFCMASTLGMKKAKPLCPDGGVKK